MLLTLKNKLMNNKQGMVMHSEAIRIRDNPGYYNLYNHNCNQVAQIILSAGGKDFAPSEFDWIGTMPNVVKTKEFILNYLSNHDDIFGIFSLEKDESRIGILCGEIGDFQFKNGCISKR